ncbi:MAG: HipA domain-containing protein [Erysipelothrix sp.]|jgi:serine/threonine-protein kinase HipA|nr:HipA domain-containing protein [Erysipelothrix sp.]
MNCYCCGKQIKSENVNGWHTSCIKRFFGTSTFPSIEIDEKALRELANDGSRKGFTIPGVQKKLSLHLYKERKQQPRLTLIDYPMGYILKPQVQEYENLPESEHLIMKMAEVTGISTVPHALIKESNQYAYITKRIDRVINGHDVKKLAMEDFCQLDQRLTEDKYRGSYERCAKIVQKYSSKVGLDMTELFLRVVFSFVVGNSDMHLKNFSLIETDEGSNHYILSPAYDILPVSIILPEDNEEVALSLNGKKTNLRKNDFYAFSKQCGLSKIVADRMINKVVSLKEHYIEMCNESLLPQHLKLNLIDLINKRISVLL